MLIGQCHRLPASRLPQRPGVGRKEPPASNAGDDNLRRGLRSLPEPNISDGLNRVTASNSHLASEGGNPLWHNDQTTERAEGQAPSARLYFCGNDYPPDALFGGLPIRGGSWSHGVRNTAVMLMSRCRAMVSRRSNNSTGTRIANILVKFVLTVAMVVLSIWS